MRFIVSKVLRIRFRSWSRYIKDVMRTIRVVVGRRRGRTRRLSGTFV